MLRYKAQARPDLVALYDIRPGNGAGLFIQPRSPHTALLPITSSNVNQFSDFLASGLSSKTFNEMIRGFHTSVASPHYIVKH